jgi:hypothetical protein
MTDNISDTLSDNIGEGIVGELQRMREVAAGLRQRLARARAGGPPQVEATDRTGAVRAVLDADGLPEAIRVADDWQGRLAAGDLGPAVIEACQAAGAKRMAAWSQALHTDDDRDSDRDGLHWPVSVPTDPLPARLRGQVAQARPRPIDALAEDMIAAFDRVDQIAAASPLARTVTGRDASARLAVTLSAAGLVSCAAPKAWVGQQTGSTLTSALGQALSAARDALAGTAGGSDRAGQPGQPAELGRLDQVFAEALAILTNPKRLTGS